MPKMKKIYITSLHTRHGGCEFVVTSLANAFVRRGYPVEVLISYNFGEVAYPFDERVKLTYLTDVLPNRAELKAALKSLNPARIFKEAKYSKRVLQLKRDTMRDALASLSDCTVIATRTDHAVLLSKYGKDSVKKIAQLHADYTLDKGTEKSFREGYGNIDYFTQLTPKLEAEVKEILKDNKHTRVVTIPNFIIPEELPENPVKKKQFIAAGRLHPDKNFQSLLRVWRAVCDKHPDYRLKICGEGEEKEALSSYARELGIEDSVVLAGALPHSELVREMAESVGYVLTSRSEMFPLVLLEALYASCPVCTYDYRVGAASIVEDNSCGFIVENGDEAALAEKICRLIENPGEAERMSRNAALRAEEFSEDSVMKKWLEIIED